MDCNGIADAAVLGGAPKDTFFWASNKVPTALQIAPLLFPALGVGFLTANWFIAAIPGGRDFFNQSSRTLRPDFDNTLGKVSRR
jgi:hypothetical protein